MNKSAILARLKRLFSNRIRAAIIIIVLLAVGLFGWQKIQSAMQQPQYQTAQVEKGTIVSAITVSGQVLQASRMPVTTSASGIVKTVFVKNGDTVTVGQSIAEITVDAQSAQKQAAAYASYLSAQNTLAAAQSKVNSLQSALFKANQAFVNDKGVDNPTDEQKADPKYIEENAEWLASEADYKNQQNVIAQAQAALSSAWFSYQASSPIITAPIAGIVSNVGLVEGMVLNSSSSTDQATSSQRVAVIQNESNPIISVNLSEIDVPKVVIGQKATITLDSLPNKTFTGKIVTIDRIGMISSSVTNYPATIQLDIASPEVLPNMATTASIIIETKSDVLTVPSTAVQTQGGQSFVRVFRNGQEQQMPVEVGISSDTDIEVISGLSEGDEVITGTVSNNSGQQRSTSVFSTGFGGGGLRSGGSGGGGARQGR